jgi:hypothetical protein
MEILLAFAALALVIPLGFLAVPPVVSAWRRRHETKRYYGNLWMAGRPKLVIPEAGDTAAVIKRFRRAVLHSDLADYFTD